MRTQPNLAIRVTVAALAMSACGVAAGISVRLMAQVKRNVVRDVLGGGRTAPSSDGGLAGCAALSAGHEVAVGDYPKIAALFASSRWPDLRNSGLAWVEIVTKQRDMHAYGGETVWFYQRLSAACAEHGQPLAY
jgi:hypothetical protein